jgi:hypothetical protein
MLEAFEVEKGKSDADEIVEDEIICVLHKSKNCHFRNSYSRNCMLKESSIYALCNNQLILSIKEDKNGTGN